MILRLDTLTIMELNPKQITSNQRLEVTLTFEANNANVNAS